ncbi:hypothetical protein D1872_256400 [compost metagenome]
MQQSANFRIRQQHKFIDRVQPDPLISFAAILLICLKGKKLHIVRLIAFFLGQRVLRQSESAVNLILQAKQRIDSCAPKTDNKHRVINRIYSNFIADDTSAKRNIQLLNMLSNYRLHILFPPIT